MALQRRHKMLAMATASVSQTEKRMLSPAGRPQPVQVVSRSHNTAAIAAVQSGIGLVLLALGVVQRAALNRLTEGVADGRLDGVDLVPDQGRDLVAQRRLP